MCIAKCAVTGRIAGDRFACGDCDPCILGAHKVPDVVKELLRERDEWIDKYADAMAELDDGDACHGPDDTTCPTCGLGS